ncbi:MAG: hypothetical protein KAX49_15060 [Halanaerobiales bacterium]|nr:hypothetical protein [Halanaerobiales bacterium]
MKLQITLCHSILEYCLLKANIFQRDNDANNLMEEIKRRKIIVNFDLEAYWRNFFEEECPELLSFYETFLSDFVLYADDCELLERYIVSDKANQHFDDNDDYKKLLYNICSSTKDKILFTELMDNLINSIQNEVDIYNVARILDQVEEHALNLYRLPIVNKQIVRGDSNVALSNWLKRFIESEMDLIICDNYVCENEDNLLNYILVHIPNGSKIKVYTLDPCLKNNRMNEKDIKDLFLKAPFASWDFEVHLVGNKKDNHSREIVTNDYIINLDKGLATFGRMGKTDQSVININYNNNSYIVPKSRKIL